MMKVIVSLLALVSFGILLFLGYCGYENLRYEYTFVEGSLLPVAIVYDKWTCKLSIPDGYFKANYNLDPTSNKKLGVMQGEPMAIDACGGAGEDEFAGAVNPFAAAAEGFEPVLPAGFEPVIPVRGFPD